MTFDGRDGKHFSSLWSRVITENVLAADVFIDIYKTEVL